MQALTQVTFCTGMVRWPSGDWHAKLFKSLRSRMEAAMDPQEPAGAQPWAGWPRPGSRLPSPALAQAFEVFEAWLNMSSVIVPGNPDERRTDKSESS